MRIFNIMMSRELGGIQQVFLDYDKALKMQNHQVFNIVSSGAAILNQVTDPIKLPNLFSRCLISKIALRILIWKYKPDIIIAHGGRAINFAKAFKPKSLPLVGVAHNYTYKRLKLCDYVIVLTEDLHKYMQAKGYNPGRLFLLGNMLEVKNKYQQRKFNNPIVIGSLGRFVEKKGFKYFIKATSILRKQSVNFKALLGGNGEEFEKLKKLVKKLGLQDTIKFIGWVDDKDKFFEQIDIFCLPSLHEPFGLVLLESMEYSVPIVSTDSEGPSEILRKNQDALIVKSGLPEEMASALMELINNPEKAAMLAESAYLRLLENYDMGVISKKLSTILSEIISK